jgi:hypothetical protein
MKLFYFKSLGEVAGEMSEKITYYKYVPNGFVWLWQEAGWVAHPDVLGETHHGYYSTYMEWTGKDEPICPPHAGAA